MLLIIGLVSTLASAYGLTLLLLRHSPVARLVDHPNVRSSHTTPTPRGGGLSIVVVTMVVFLALCGAGVLSVRLTVALVVGGLLVAAVGFCDDIRSVPVAVRMAIHFAAAIIAVLCLGSAPVLNAGSLTVDIGVAAPVVNVLAIVWVLNLFNFMDGIDGIAASEAIFICLGATVIGLFLAHGTSAQMSGALLTAAATLGFLRWNWPRAAIFMGDVGSGYLGYVIAVLAISSAQTSALNVYVWLILGGAFFVDATLTLCRRLWRGERAHQPHRTHAYQWLARRWNSHAKVTGALIAIDVLWLLPVAALAVKLPEAAPWIWLGALAPIWILAWLCGAGRAEEATQGCA